MQEEYGRAESAAASCVNAIHASSRCRDAIRHAHFQASPAIQRMLAWRLEDAMRALVLRQIERLMRLDPLSRDMEAANLKNDWLVMAGRMPVVFAFANRELRTRGLR